MNTQLMGRMPVQKTGGPSMQAIQVLDLAAVPERRGLWRARNASTSAPQRVPGLPEGGQASSMGYWLAGVADTSALTPGALRLTFRAPGEAPSNGTDPSIGELAVPGGRPPQAVRLKALNAGDGDLFLTVGPAGAHVVASEAAWKTLAEPVLLAVCQYWRFCAVDAEVDRLTALAHGDIGHATLPTMDSLRDRKRLAANAQDVRALLVDLPHFEGPLDDALCYCSSERSAQVYQSLAEKLRLEEWCELIDDRVEAVEDTYEAVTEKLFEFKNFAWEALLEALIIVILLGELGFLAWETFSLGP